MTDFLFDVTVELAQPRLFHVGVQIDKDGSGSNIFMPPDVIGGQCQRLSDWYLHLFVGTEWRHELTQKIE